MIDGWLVLYGMVTIAAVWLAINCLRHPSPDESLLSIAFLLIAIGCGVIPGGMWLIASDTLSLPEWWISAVLLAGWVYAFVAHARIAQALHRKRSTIRQGQRSGEGER